jgi:myosin heavy subunit
MSSLNHYQLLTCDTDEDQIMEQHYEKQKNDYSYFSSSAPTIIDSGLICESRR